MKETTLDTKILNKNLEITKLTKQIDDLISKNVELISENVELKEQLTEKATKYMLPMYMLNILDKCFFNLKYHEEAELAKDLRNVIKFLQQ